MSDKLWSWIRVPLAVLIIAVLGVIGVAVSTPAQGTPAQLPAVKSVQAVSEATGWTYVSAEQNALDQLREQNAKAAGLKVGTIFGCPEAYVCLYHWINYEGGRWQTWPGNWPNNFCWDLSGSHYTDGYNVNNTSASMIINRDAVAPLQMVMYNWVQCQSGGGLTVYNANDPTFRTNLSQGGSGDWYHKFTSMEFYG